jgi:hypothetical protein
LSNLGHDGQVYPPHRAVNTGAIQRPRLQTITDEELTRRTPAGPSPIAAFWVRSGHRVGPLAGGRGTADAHRTTRISLKTLRFGWPGRSHARVARLGFGLPRIRPSGTLPRGEEDLIDLRPAARLGRGQQWVTRLLHGAGRVIGLA